MKRDDLLKNLKKADKRRQRRPDVPAQAPTPISHVEAERLGHTLVSIYNQHPSLTDRQVASAAQCVLQQRTSNDPMTQKVQSAIEQLLQSGVGEQSRWRKELLSLCQTIREQFVDGDVRGYLEYIRALSN